MKIKCYILISLIKSLLSAYFFIDSVSIQAEVHPMSPYYLYTTQNWYKEANKNSMATGYSLPYDIPIIKQAKKNSSTTSDVSTKTAFHHLIGPFL